MNKLLDIIPEGFYEALTYILPSAFFVGMLLLTLKLDISIPIDDSGLSKLVNSDFIAAVVIVSGLFVLGQILNTLCYFALMILPWQIWRKLLNYDKSWWKHEMRWRCIKNRKIDLGGVLSKVRLKWILSLNISFSSLLVLLSFPLSQVLPWISIRDKLPLGFTIVFLLIIAIAAMIDAGKRFKNETDFLTSLEENLGIVDTISCGHEKHPDA